MPTHGSVTLAVDGVTIYNAEATQSCDTGYSLSGEESIRCSADGRWSSSPVVCTIKSKTIICYIVLLILNIKSTFEKHVHVSLKRRSTGNQDNECIMCLCFSEVLMLFSSPEPKAHR